MSAQKEPTEEQIQAALAVLTGSSVIEPCVEAVGEDDGSLLALAEEVARAVVRAGEGAGA